MRTTHILLGMLALSGGLVITAGGCSSDPDPVDPTGSGGTGPGSGGATTNGGAGPSSTSTGAGGTGDGNDSFEEAIDMAIDSSVTGEINPDDDYDFFKFQGQAGQSLYIFADAKPNTDPFGDGYVDTVVELFDESQQRIAMNDDPFPRTTQDSTLITELPATGTYYLRISDFCTWDVDHGSGQGCGAGYILDNRSYTLAVVNIDYDEVGNVDEAEGAMEYGSSSGATASGYYAPLVHGTFDDAGDVDTYSFKVPDAWVITNTNGGRPTAYFEIFPAGDTGNGSTAPMGNLWVTAAADPNGVKLAEIDGSKIDPTFGMSISLPLGNVGATNFSGTPTLYLHAATSASNIGTNPFYFVTHYGGGSNEIELAEASDGFLLNDVPNDAETPTLQTSSGGFDSYFVGGNLGALGTDVDFFFLDLAGIDPTLTVLGSCAAKRIGSGLQNFKMTLVDDDGTTVVATGTESATANATLGENVAIPSGATHLYLKVEASGQDLGHIGNYYQCGVVFFDPS
jgi:hypothetical protein